MFRLSAARAEDDETGGQTDPEDEEGHQSDEEVRHCGCDRRALGGFVASGESRDDGHYE